MSWRLLDDAAGYVVYGSDGRRLGTVIELVPGEAEMAGLVAIRCDRIFLWRRRTVPVAAVAGIDPAKRTVTLLLDASGVEQAHEQRADELPEGWVADRVTRYAEAPIAEAEAPADDADPASESPRPEGSDALDAAGDGLGPIPTEPGGEEVSRPHVLFVPTGAGYVLIERGGAAPGCAARLELADPPGSFAVVKVARSPLPDDQRLCAYLDRLD